MSSALIGAGEAALRAGDAAAARRAFESAVGEVASGEALEGLAQALYFEREYPASAACYERAYAAYRGEGQTMAAGRAARTVAWITGSVLGDWAVQNGWLARARTVLDEAGADRAERGWVLIIESFSEPDPQARESLLREAIAIGRRFGDPDVEFDALSYLGGLFVLTDRVADGLVLFDEALAAACAGELTDLASVDSMFCGFFWACELVNDVPRADQWMRAAAGRMQRSSVVAAFCRAHYGGILTAAGRWTEAETELVEAARQFDRGVSARRAAAVIRLAALRVRQGRLEEAGQLLAGLEQHPDVGPHARRPAPGPRRHGAGAGPAGAGHRTRGRRGPRQSGTRSWWDRCWPCSSTSTSRRGASRTPPAPPERLGRIAAAQRGPYLRAAAALARGRVCIASGHPDARACLHEALAGFARAQLPMELARTRLEMALALADRSPEVAIAEAKAALEDFERLAAARHADAAGALLRSLGAPVRTGAKGVGALTKREAEVLLLLGAGLSNPEIGRPALHHPQDRRDPRREPAVEARPAEPGRGGRLRDAGEDQPVARGPPRYFPAGRAEMLPPWLTTRTT